MVVNGWLKAFRVTEANKLDADRVQYKMHMVEFERGPQYQWVDPS